MSVRYPLVFVVGVLAGFFFPKLMRAVLDNDLVGILSDCAIAELRARINTRVWKSWAYLAGTAVCEASAALLCFLFQGSTYDSIVPLGFLLIVVACARHFGALAGILGSVSAAGTFALFLFAPVGKFGVAESAARITLAVLVIGGIVLSYYLASGRSQNRVAAAGAHR